MKAQHILILILLIPCWIYAQKLSLSVWQIGEKESFEGLSKTQELLSDLSTPHQNIDSVRYLLTYLDKKPHKMMIMVYLDSLDFLVRGLDGINYLIAEYYGSLMIFALSDLYNTYGYFCPKISYNLKTFYSSIGIIYLLPRIDNGISINVSAIDGDHNNRLVYVNSVQYGKNLNEINCENSSMESLAFITDDKKFVQFVLQNNKNSDLK